MSLGPIDTDDLSPTDREDLLGLVRRSRLFDLPSRLSAPKAAWEDAPSPEGPSESVTITIKATGRTGTVS